MATHHAVNRQQLGLLRVAVVTPELRVADVTFNCQTITDALSQLATQQVAVAVFPELALTSYSCGDLFYQETLLNGARTALQGLAQQTAKWASLLSLVLPLAVDGRIFNCAAFLAGGEILASSPNAICPPRWNIMNGVGSHRRPGHCQKREDCRQRRALWGRFAL